MSDKFVQLLQKPYSIKKLVDVAHSRGVLRGIGVVVNVCSVAVYSHFSSFCEF